MTIVQFLTAVRDTVSAVVGLIGSPAVGLAVVVVLIIQCFRSRYPEMGRNGFIRPAAGLFDGALEFILAAFGVLLTLGLWAVVFRLAYWAAHAKFPDSPVTYAWLDYPLLLGSLAAATWLSFRLLNPPQDS